MVEALAEHRVDTLLVSKGYGARVAVPGLRPAGGHGAALQGCGGTMVEVEDLVEDAVEEALAQSCQVEICVGNADLDVMGRIGALLRY